MANEDINNKMTAINEFVQGSPLPYSVLDASHINAAYPEQKLKIRGGGYGSDAAAHPTNAKQFYALTDRGPNADFDGIAGKGKQFLVQIIRRLLGCLNCKLTAKLSK